MGEFNFGELILQVLENEDKKKLQKQQMAEESSYRSAVLENERARLRADTEGRQAQISESQRLNPSVSVRSVLDTIGFTPAQQESVVSQLKPGTLASRHNNPLNIKYGAFAEKYGATAGEDSTDGGKFAKFSSVEAGLTAASALLQSKSYSGLTVDQAMKKWSNRGYGGEIAPDMSSKKVGDLSDQELDSLVNTMSRREGSTTGGVLGQDQSVGGSDFLDQKLPLSNINYVLDAIEGMERIKVSKEQRQALSEYRLAVLGKQKEADKEAEATRAFVKKWMDLGSVAPPEKLETPQSPAGRALAQSFSRPTLSKIGIIPGFGFVPGTKPSLMDVVDLVSSPFTSSKNVSPEAARNLTKMLPYVNANIEGAQTILTSIEKEGRVTSAHATSAEASLQAISGILQQHTDGLIHLDEGNLTYIKSLQSRLATLLGFRMRAGEETASLKTQQRVSEYVGKKEYDKSQEE